MKFWRKRAAGGEIPSDTRAPGRPAGLIHRGAHLTGDEVQRLRDAGLTPSEIHDVLMERAMGDGK